MALFAGCTTQTGTSKNAKLKNTMQANTLKLARQLLLELGATTTDNGEQGTWLVNGSLPGNVRVSVQDAKGTPYNTEAAQIHVSIGLEGKLWDFTPTQPSRSEFYSNTTGNFSTRKTAAQIASEINKRGLLDYARKVAADALARQQADEARQAQKHAAHAKAVELLGGKVVGAGHEHAYAVFPETFWLHGRAEVKPDAHGMVTLVLTCSPEAAAAAALTAQEIDN